MRQWLRGTGKRGGGKDAMSLIELATQLKLSDANGPDEHLGHSVDILTTGNVRTTTQLWQCFDNTVVVVLYFLFIFCLFIA